MYHEYKSTIHCMMEVTTKNVHTLGHLGRGLHYLHHGQYTIQYKDNVTITKQFIIVFCIPNTIINHLDHKRFIRLQNTFGKCKHWNPFCHNITNDLPTFCLQFFLPTLQVPYASWGSQKNTHTWIVERFQSLQPMASLKTFAQPNCNYGPCGGF